ncbi:metallophosphoesterase 1 homolog [Palaemon carinicauda]|uniref:metallophosphoesterase 1 homolog n=1 Tax=Palaemon carinicauda TaxID=392227 RepID=UPI0035B5F801
MARMLSLPQFRITKYGFIIGMLFTAILFNEWLMYVVKALRWPDITDIEEDNVRVLIAADPQILSTDTEPHFPLNLLTTWDADRFVSRGFHLAVWRTKPDIIIFLGDVMDDGSISNDNSFHQKVEHFKSLMYIPSYVKHTIYVPGDNDIGGEGPDKVTLHKVQRFYQEFNQSYSVSYKFLEFTQMRVMDDYDGMPNFSEEENTIRILLSHIPLLPITRKVIKEKISRHYPSFIFSGHEHDSFHFVATKKELHAQEFWPLKADGNVWVFDHSGHKLHEVTVPTCSYRMGKKSYGYGFAVIGKSGLVHYTVLWLPSRFSQLWMYLMCITAALFLILPNICMWMRHRLFSVCRSCLHYLCRKCPKYHSL